MIDTGYTIHPIGVLRSELTSREAAPFQGYEGGRDRRRPLTGVFSRRSPDRPNPLGLHRVTVREISPNRLRVGPI
jgi:tRNA (Thr-GGU) A37 N-methylase